MIATFQNHLNFLVKLKMAKIALDDSKDVCMKDKHCLFRISEFSMTISAIESRSPNQIGIPFQIRQTWVFIINSINSTPKSL